jgi:hypothetical protein
MTPFEAYLLLTGNIVKKILLFFIAIRQRKYLNWLYQIEGWNGQKDKEVVIIAFQKWIAIGNGQQLKEAGIETDNFSFQTLLAYGAPTYRPSCLTNEHLQILHRVVQRILRKSKTFYDVHGTFDYGEFLNWCRSHPGKVSFTI